MKPACHNRPPFDTVMSQGCKVWERDDHRIMDPAHPKFGTDAGDFYPLANGFSCHGCRWLPKEHA